MDGCELTFSALCALEEGYDAYVVTDTSGSISAAAHEAALERMIQAGVVPLTWRQIVFEWQRDWSGGNTFDAVIDVMNEHGGGHVPWMSHTTTA